MNTEMHSTNPETPPHTRVVAWNVLFIILGMTLISITGEAYLRLTTPSMTEVETFTFDPKVGLLYEPHTEVRSTNRIDFWSAGRVSRWGFLDREPIDLKRAATGCHIVMIGDSFVTAKHVPISNKFHVQLEEAAASSLPHLNLHISTSAFGMPGTGQINQLPYYDEFARRLPLKAVVLVLIPNDFRDNVPRKIRAGAHMSAKRGEDGTLILVPPDPDYEFPEPGIVRRLKNVARISYFFQWLDAKIDAMGVLTPRQEPFAFQDGLDFMGFALDQFKKRTDRDGVALLILTAHSMRKHGLFDPISDMSEERGIPIIDQHDYILRQGGNIADATFTHDSHWSPLGHRWAAEALLEYLKENQEVCTRRPLVPRSSDYPHDDLHRGTTWAVGKETRNVRRDD